MQIASQQTWSNRAKCVFQCKTVYFGHSNTGKILKRIIQIEPVHLVQLQMYSKMCVSDRSTTTWKHRANFVFQGKTVYFRYYNTGI